MNLADGVKVISIARTEHEEDGEAEERPEEGEQSGETGSETGPVQE